jgi:AraC-like DNA-binding protein
MTMGLKEMIERCIRRARSGACATCDHKGACAAGHWEKAFAFAGPAAAAKPRSFDPAPFLGFFTELGKALQAGAAPRKTAFRREVEQKLEPLLDGGDIGIERIAGELGLSRQTLYRRLKSEGVTFEQVLDDLRHRVGLRLLKEGLGVKQVAYRLGFSDPAAFSRAFKRWTGRSPSASRP